MLIIKRREGAERSPVRQCLVLSMVRALEICDVQGVKARYYPRHIPTALNALTSSPSIYYMERPVGDK